MSAIFGFTFHMGRMTEVLTPDIYRAHWLWKRDMLHIKRKETRPRRQAVQKLWQARRLLVIPGRSKTRAVKRLRRP